MTESITTPFTLTTREACEKACAVILGPPSPLVESDVECHYVADDELEEFTEYICQKRREREAKKAAEKVAKK